MCNRALGLDLFRKVCTLLHRFDEELILFRQFPSLPGTPCALDHASLSLLALAVITGTRPYSAGLPEAFPDVYSPYSARIPPVCSCRSPSGDGGDSSCAGSFSPSPPLCFTEPSLRHGFPVSTRSNSPSFSYILRFYFLLSLIQVTGELLLSQTPTPPSIPKGSEPRRQRVSFPNNFTSSASPHPPLPEQTTPLLGFSKLKTKRSPSLELRFF